MKKLLLSIILGMMSLCVNAITWNSNYMQVCVDGGDFGDYIKSKTIITFTEPSHDKKGVYTFNTEGAIFKVYLSNIYKDGTVETYDSEGNMFWISFINMPNYGVVAILVKCVSDNKTFLYDLIKK